MKGKSRGGQKEKEETNKSERIAVRRRVLGEFSASFCKKEHPKEDKIYPNNPPYLNFIEKSGNYVWFFILSCYPPETMMKKYFHLLR